VTRIACLPSRGAISVEREYTTAIARVLRTFTGCLHIVGRINRSNPWRQFTDIPNHAMGKTLPPFSSLIEQERQRI
jgi:hypothetical protein